MNIKRNIIFTLERRKKIDVLVTNNVPIRMRVIYGGNRIDFSTGSRIDTSKWDSDKQLVKNGCTNKLKQSSSEINADLLKYYTNIQNIFKEFEVTDVTPTPEKLKSAFNKKCRKGISDETETEISKASFMNIFDEFLKECGMQNNWSDSTYKKFAAVKNHLTNFNSNLTFEVLDESGLSEYVNYLRDKKDMRNSSIGKQIGFLKWFLRWALKKGHHNNNAFEIFKPKLKTTPKKVIFLTWDELSKLRNYKIPETKQYLERVRDVFLFTCFTGLRYSDVYNLKTSDIKDNHIEITT
ncbi:MAG: phage integrase SAM-like domain-containing protein, partial [Bacteroidota bacterium]|nr:phage integrase SAM-like domain-containing protein [Bacteroidota bacterium]